MALLALQEMSGACGIEAADGGDLSGQKNSYAEDRANFVYRIGRKDAGGKGSVERVSIRTRCSGHSVGRVAVATIISSVEAARRPTMSR